MKKPLLAAALAIALATTTSGCAAMMKFMGDMTAAAITQKTANLSELSVRASYVTNLFPKDSGLVEAVDSGDTWQEGQNLLGVVLLKRQGVGMYELDGAIGYQDKPNGPIVPIPYVGKGAYQIALNGKDFAPKTIILRTAGGQEARLRVAPAKPITLKAINGKPAKGATLDLNKDVVLDLANPPGTAGTPIKVSIAIQAMGIHTMSAVGIFKAADRVTVPKEAFRNMLVSASHDVGAVGILKGANYLLVERYEQGLPAAGVGAAETLGQAWTWAPVTVTGDAPMNSSLQADGKLPGSTSEVGFMVFKPNAFYGPPLPMAKTVALGTLRARGKLYESKTYESKSYGYQTVTTTTTTITKQFPEVPDGHWNALLKDLETRLTASLKRVTNTALLPAERLAGSPTYKAMKEIAEQRDTRAGATSYIVKIRPGSRHVLPESLDTIDVSSTFPADRPISRIMRESKTDGLLSVTLDLQIATAKDSEKLVLIPRLSWVMYAEPNGYLAFPASYGQGFVEATDGVPFNAEALQKNPAEMSRVARLPELVNAFEASLKALRAKEQAAGYDAIWRGR
ncbi:MAG: hypothetical protein ACK46X_00915 [Candidatus Sericytochromatia bacterium]